MNRSDFDPTHDFGAIPLEITGRLDDAQLTELFVDAQGSRYELPLDAAERRTRLPRPGEIWQNLTNDYQWADEQGRLINFKDGRVAWKAGDTHLDELERVTHRYRQPDGTAPPEHPRGRQT